jgi:hypothetical protein
MRKILMSLLFIIAIGLVSGVIYKTAYGMCVCPQDDGVALEDYPTIFIGKVIDIQLKGETFKEFEKRIEGTELDVVSAIAIMKVKVEDLLKGRLNKIVKVEGLYGCCCDALHFSKGRSYIFFGYSNGKDEVSAVGHCEGTQAIDEFGALFELKKKIKSQKKAK